MASEIEVVEEVESRDQGQSTSLANGAGEIEEESLRNDVYTAAAYGDMDKLQRLVESEGCSVSEPDHLGYYALQWAALNNRTAAAQYIIEVKFLVIYFLNRILKIQWINLVFPFHCFSPYITYDIASYFFFSLELKCRYACSYCSLAESLKA